MLNSLQLSKKGKCRHCRNYSEITKSCYCGLKGKIKKDTMCPKFEYYGYDEDME